MEDVVGQSLLPSAHAGLFVAVNPNTHTPVVPHRNQTDAVANIDRLRRARVGRWKLAKLMLHEAARMAQTEPPSMRHLAQLIGAKMKHPDMAHTTVLRFFRGDREPSPDATIALCLVLKDYGVDTDPGWLEFGPASEAPAPTMYLAGTKVSVTAVPGYTRKIPRSEYKPHKPKKKKKKGRGGQA